MRVRFVVLLVVAVLAFAFVVAPLFGMTSWYIAHFLCAVLFILNRPMPGSRVLFRRRRLDEREQKLFHRTDSLAITILILVIIVQFGIFAIVSAAEVRIPFDSPLPILFVFVYSSSQVVLVVPFFVLIHSITGLVVFSRR